MKMGLQVSSSRQGESYHRGAGDAAPLVKRRLYPNKLSVTAVHVMNNDVLLTFEAQGARIATVLSDNGREDCGRSDRHPFELFLQLEEIERRTTKIRRPQSNGFVERLYRTLLDEHFRIMGRKKFYESIDEMQATTVRRIPSVQIVEYYI